MMISLILSHKIWFGNDFVPRFPINPVFDIGDGFSGALFCLLFLSCILVFITNKKWATLSTVFLFFFALCTDWNKAQAYFYIPVMLMGISAVKEKAENLSYYLFAIGGIYLWSGIQKLNVFYYHGFFPSKAKELEVTESNDGIANMVEDINPEWVHDFLHSFLTLVPFIEILMGIGMLLYFTRKWTSYIAIGLHLGILVYLIHTDYNQIVWHWNAFMIIYHIVLLSKTNPFRMTVSPKIILATFFFAVTPTINLYTDHIPYLSWNLYSYRIPYAFFSVNYDDPDFNEEELSQLFKLDSTESYVDPIQYSMKHTMVSINPEPWIFKQWIQKTADNPNIHQSLMLYLYTYSFNDRKEEYIMFKK